MKYGVLLWLLAIILVFTAWTYRGVYWALLYPATSAAIVGSGYLSLGHSVFAKRPNGRLPIGTYGILGPYLLLSYGIWHAIRWCSRTDSFNWVNSWLCISRRLLPSEFPDGIVSVVDLTSEFTEPDPICQRSHYVSFPMLDGFVRSPQEIRALAEAITKMPRPVLIHCAQGYGRTGLVGAAALMANGDAESVEQAIQMLQSSRPGVSLNRDQMRTLNAIV